MTTARLAKKVDWEGGVENAIRYGIRSTQIAYPDLAATWREPEGLYAEVEPKLRGVERRLREAAWRRTLIFGLPCWSTRRS
jgi:hypothetical protein